MQNQYRMAEEQAVGRAIQSGLMNVAGFGNMQAAFNYNPGGVDPNVGVDPGMMGQQSQYMGQNPMGTEINFGQNNNPVYNWMNPTGFQSQDPGAFGNVTGLNNQGAVQGTNMFAPGANPYQGAAFSPFIGGNPFPGSFGVMQNWQQAFGNIPTATPPAIY
jgi:hypothetical protein